MVVLDGVLNMFYSQSKNGFYLESVHGVNIPLDAVEISDAVHDEMMRGQTAGKVIGSDERGYPALRDPEIAPIPVQTSVSMNQARQALIDADLDEAVDAAIASMPEGKEQKKAKTAWEYAQTVERSSPFVAMIAAALGLSEDRLDELFVAASLIQ